MTFQMHVKFMSSNSTESLTEMNHKVHFPIWIRASINIFKNLLHARLSVMPCGAYKDNDTNKLSGKETTRRAVSVTPVTRCQLQWKACGIQGRERWAKLQRKETNLSGGSERTKEHRFWPFAGPLRTPPWSPGHACTETITSCCIIIMSVRRDHEL